MIRYGLCRLRLSIAWAMLGFQILFLVISLRASSTILVVSAYHHPVVFNPPTWNLAFFSDPERSWLCHQLVHYLARPKTGLLGVEIMDHSTRYCRIQLSVSVAVIMRENQDFLKQRLDNEVRDFLIKNSHNVTDILDVNLGFGGSELKMCSISHEKSSGYVLLFHEGTDYGAGFIFILFAGILSLVLNLAVIRVLSSCGTD